MARRILVLQALVIAAIVGAVLIAMVIDTQDQSERSTASQVSYIARTVAETPSVREILTTDFPAGQEVSGPAMLLAPYVQKLSKSTGADFVVFMRLDGTRLSHPDPARIGETYIGSREQALAGQTYVETYSGTLGPSLRAITPVRDEGGRIIGLVSVGVTVANISAGSPERFWALGLISFAALLLGVIGAVLIARWVKRLTLGMGPRELAKRFHYYDAVLSSVHEGMILLDRSGGIVGVNGEGRRLLGLPDESGSARPTRADLPAEVERVLDESRTVRDELVLTIDRVLVVNRSKAVVDGREVGAVVTLRDHTELESLTGELDRVRGFTSTLRAQAHESANRLHTVISLIELGETERALEFAVRELSVAQSLADQVVEGVGDRAIAALLLGKSAQAAERGIELAIDEDTYIPDGLVDPHEVVTILGNLIDNAFDAVTGTTAPRRVEVSGYTDDEELTLVVSDSGPGLTIEQAKAVFMPGFTTKFNEGPAGHRGLGLPLVAQAVARCGGVVEACPGPGARFTVVIPICPETRLQRSREAGQPQVVQPRAVQPWGVQQ